MSSTARLATGAAARRSAFSRQCSLPTPGLHDWLCLARVNKPFSIATLSRPHSRIGPRGLSSHARALAILVPQRSYATDTATHGRDGAPFPPPGFNVDEAKKPLPETKKASQSSTKDVDQNRNEQHTVNKTEGTAVEKSKALENTASSELADAKMSVAAKPDEKAAAKKEEEKKLKKELQHYWDGTKLLATEVKISSKLALKMAAGYELSRRENRQAGILDGTISLG